MRKSRFHRGISLMLTASLLMACCTGFTVNSEELAGQDEAVSMEEFFVADELAAGDIFLTDDELMPADPDDQTEDAGLVDFEEDLVISDMDAEIDPDIFEGTGDFIDDFASDELTEEPVDEADSEEEELSTEEELPEEEEIPEEEAVTEEEAADEMLTEAEFEDTMPELEMAPAVGILDDYVDVAKGGVKMPSVFGIEPDGFSLDLNVTAMISSIPALDGIQNVTAFSSTKYIRWNRWRNGTAISDFPLDKGQIISSITAYEARRNSYSNTSDVVKFPEEYEFQLAVCNGGEEYLSHKFKLAFVKGTCGANATFEYSASTNTLEIKGTGSTNDYNNSDKPTPWKAYRGNIKKVIVRDGITGLGSALFMWAQNVESVQLPASVTSIGNFCFSTLYKLSSFTLAEGSKIQKIGQEAFQSCKALTSLAFPAATEISMSAFRYCDGLEKLELLSPDLKTISANTPFGDAAKLTLYVRANTAGSKFYRGDKWAEQKVKGIQIQIDKATVSGITDQTYTGSALTPKPVVKDNEYTLKEGTDYTVTYKDNTDVGTASLVITGKGDYYGSTASYSFKIKPSASQPRPAAEATPQNPKPLATVQSTIAAMTSDKDVKGSSFSLLQLQATSKLKKVTLKWKKVTGATSYIIYGAKCGKANKLKKIKTVTTNKFTHSGRKKGTYYKYLVVAVKGSSAIAVSKTIHIATKGGKVGNTTKVTLNKKQTTLKPKKTFKLTATLKNTAQPVKNHRARRVFYESSDIRVAKVGAKGKITAVGKGTCYVYAYAQNGRMARIKVTVK